MATGPYDLGPFQTLSAINFAQGDIFGRIAFKFGPIQGARTDPQAAPISCTGLTTASGIPNPLLSGYTFVGVQIFVGSSWELSPLNPFSPDLSTSPATISNLEGKTVTHVSSGENFKLADISGNSQLCQRTASGTEGSTWGLSSGITYTGGGLARAEYFQVAVNVAGIGTATELWSTTYWYNDANGWPSVTNRARFFDNGAVDDKVTFT